MGAEHGPDACSHTSLPPTQTGVEGLGTKRTCVTVPRVKLGRWKDRRLFPEPVWPRLHGDSKQRLKAALSLLGQDPALPLSS